MAAIINSMNLSNALDQTTRIQKLVQSRQIPGDGYEYFQIIQ